MRLAVLSLVLFAAACGGDDGGSSQDVDGGGTSGDGGGTTDCPRVAKAADRTRHIVLARPYKADSSSAPTFEVMKLEANGTMSRFEPKRTFDLGFRMPFGRIAFTPDGEVGIAALDNGKLGVFRLDDQGNATVVDPGFMGTFYAQDVVMDPAGDRAWVIDGNTRDNGGGIYEIGIGCDGSLTERGQVVQARSPGGFGFVGTTGVLAARDALDSPTTGDDVHLLDWSASPPTRIAGGDVFGDDQQQNSGFALSHDGTTVFVGDSNAFSAIPNRVAIATLGASSVTGLAVISDITDPSSISASPFGDVALVSSSQPPGEGIYVLDKLGPNGTWRNKGELTYSGPNSQLPGDQVMITRGQLAGHVLVSELSNLRQVAFEANGNVSDVGSLTFGDGIEEIGGAIGVQP